MKFKTEFLLNDLDLPYKALEQTVVDTTRWSIIYDIIFEHEGKFYQTSYSKGATEQQDEGPWEYEDEVECTEVHKVQKVVEVWVAK